VEFEHLLKILDWGQSWSWYIFTDCNSTAVIRCDRFVTHQFVFRYSLIVLSSGSIYYVVLTPFLNLKNVIFTWHVFRGNCIYLCDCNYVIEFILQVRHDVSSDIIVVLLSFLLLKVDTLKMAFWNPHISPLLQLGKSKPSFNFKNFSSWCLLLWTLCFTICINFYKMITLKITKLFLVIRLHFVTQNMCFYIFVHYDPTVCLYIP
jgi:hypothetical protein